MQSTEPLLQELLCDVLGHQRAGKERAQWSGKHPVSDELNAESDAKIAKACQQYEEMVQELVSVERHLLQAKARALTEEERRLGERKQALCGYDRLISLPSTGESSLGSFLDRQLLERNSLLHPAHYHPGSSPNSSHTLQPPLEEAPTYLCPTFTSNQHTATSQHSSVLKPSSTGQTKRPLRWRDQPLSPAVQEAGVRTLARLRQRGSCLSSSHHPGLSSTTEGEGSISGALRRRRATSRDPGNNDSPTRDVQLFAAEPNKVVFTDYQVGHTYQINVDIQNVSGCSRKMRLVPLNSPYFTITRGVSNHPEGLIAPGMHVTCTVTFTPPSLCNYQEEIKVQSHSGYCLTIPVLAVRPAPCLSLPEVIECGSCLAGGRMEVELEVKNSGGEGRFSVRATTHHQHHQQSPTQSEGVLILGPFTVSPTEFHLPPLHSTTLQVTFSPAAEGQYGEQFVIECNNGETISFSLTGSGDVVSVGCVSIGDSSLQEISQFTSDGSENHDADRSNQRGVDPVMSAVDDYDLYTEQLEECSVVFDVVNPRSPAYKTVVIRNYCGVDLPFCWKLFRPLTELSSSGEEDPVVDDLVPSVNSPFSVLPPSGTLSAASTHTFLCQFLPHKPGQYVDGCHLVLSQVPEASLDLSLEGETWRRMGDDDSTATCTVSPVCLFLSGVAQPYVLELEPPALLIPVAIPLATDIRRRVKLVNRSVSRLHYCWREPLPDEGITISPVSGSLVGGGGGGYCEVVIRRSVAGEFALNLICDIEHSTHPVTLSLHGWTQGPQVSVDCASLEFGLVPLGTSSQLTLTLTSHTHTSLPILLRHAIGTQATLPSTSGTSCRDSETDHECIHFTPSSLTLPPHTVTTLTVECRPLVTGRLRSTLQCLVDDQVIRCLAVHAEVQSPRVVLTECVVHQDTAYVGVGCERRVQMTNTSLIPTLFSWRQQVEGESGAHCSVSISPSSGSIGPRQSLPVTITATWDPTGSHPEAILCCDVEGMSEPLLLVLSAEVHGLAVSYSVQEKCVCSSSDEEELCLEFGSEVSLFSPHTLHLLVTNTTAIPTTLSTSLSSFPPSHPHLPTPHPPPHRSRKKSLLSRTVNIGDPKSKTSQQASKDYMSDLLQEGCGCCFVVDPPTSTLLPFTTHTLTVTAYADMWGDYHDTLSCQVSGLEAVEVPIHCRVTGCPLLFHSTALPQRSLVRFGSHLVNGPPAQRVVRINNTGPQEVRVDWQMFRVPREDKSGQLVDLITIIGTPFPRHTPSSPPHHHHITPSHPHLHHMKPPALPGLTPEPEPGRDGMEPGLSGDGTESGESSEGVEPCQRSEDGSQSSQGPVVCVFLRGHEGVPADRPFSVHPTQMVVPARGQSSFTVTFDPSLVGDSVSSQSAYCLGYISLDGQSCEGVYRSTGYELSPLRLDTEASLDQPQLHLEEDQETGLHFSYPASILLHGEHVLSSVSKTHHVTLVNLTSSNLSFTISCSSPRFTITPSPFSPTTSPHVHTLTPNTGLSVAVMFRVYQEDLMDCSEDKVSFSGTLLVHFSTGATQEFPLSGEIFIPHVSLSTQSLQLGPCLLGHSLSSSLTLCNTSSVPLPWTMEPAPGLCDVVSVSPSSGVLPPHVGTAGPSQQHILLYFTPQTECEYTGRVVVRESLTGCETHVVMTASTTSDEVHSTVDFL